MGGRERAGGGGHLWGKSHAGTTIDGKIVSARAMASQRRAGLLDEGGEELSIPRKSVHSSCLFRGRPKASRLAHWMPHFRPSLCCSQRHLVTVV